MKITAVILALWAASMASAGAQTEAGIPVGSGPGGVPFGAGIQRGMMGMHNSGQTGFVTVFDRGPRTAVVVQLDAALGKVERIMIQRGTSCDAIGPEVVRLNDLQRGISRGYVAMTKDVLMSGKFLAVVYGSTPGTGPVACGELYT